MYSLHAGQTTKTGVRQCLLQDNKTDFKKNNIRRLHMISFIFNYTDKYELLDVRDINTRRRDGILFSVESMNDYNYKARQDPMYRAMMAWNSLPVLIRNAETKSQLSTLMKSSIKNPYKKTE